MARHKALWRAALHRRYQEVEVVRRRRRAREIAALEVEDERWTGGSAA